MQTARNGSSLGYSAHVKSRDATGVPSRTTGRDNVMGQDDVMGES